MAHESGIIDTIARARQQAIAAGGNNRSARLSRSWRCRCAGQDRGADGQGEKGLLYRKLEMARLRIHPGHGSDAL